MNPVLQKCILGVIAFALLVEVGDAIYPEWSAACAPERLPSGTTIPAGDISLIEIDGRMFFAPVQPPGCKVTAENALRKIYYHFNPIPTGYPKGTL